jgi:transcriptional regulator with XRE-family HTH domain
MALGERIRQRRKELELTQDDLAKSLMVTPQHISAIEQNKRAPSLSSLVNMAKELGVTTDFLLTGKEGVASEAIPAIKADKTLSPDIKKALISLIDELAK